MVSFVWHQLYQTWVGALLWVPELQGIYYPEHKDRKQFRIFESQIRPTYRSWIHSSSSSARSAERWANEVDNKSTERMSLVDSYY